MQERLLDSHIVFKKAKVEKRPADQSCDKYS